MRDSTVSITDCMMSVLKSANMLLIMDFISMLRDSVPVRLALSSFDILPENNARKLISVCVDNKTIAYNSAAN